MDYKESANILVEEAKRVLIEEYKCHSVILYGSYSKGNANSKSDVDMMGFSEFVCETQRDTRVWRGIFFDLFIHPENKLQNPDENSIFFEEWNSCY